jgi:hypothetical protein
MGHFQLLKYFRIHLLRLLKSRQVLLLFACRGTSNSSLDHSPFPIQVGDTLIAVGGKGTIGRSLREVQNMLRGPPGSALTLSIASGARDPVVSARVVSSIADASSSRIYLLQDITLIRAKVPPLVRSGAAGALAQQGTRAIARDMLSHVSAPHDHIVLPFDDTWIQEIKV